MAHTGSKPRILCDLDIKKDPFIGVNDIFYKLLSNHFEVIYGETLDKDPEIGKTILGAVLLGGASIKYVCDHLPILPNLKIAANHGVGVNHIPFPLFKERNIKVSNTPGVLSECTADMAMALMLASARNIIAGYQEARSADPKLRFRGNYFGVAVNNATIGIIGMGRIGFEVAKRARGFNMSIMYHNRNRTSNAEQVNAKYFNKLGEMLPHCDFVVVTCALTPETRHILGEQEFSVMKPTATVINVSRGATINQDALVTALKNNLIRGAALDVTDPEPLPRDHQLLTMENVIITPHWGSATVQTRTKMYDLVIENLIAGIAGKPVPNEVCG